MDTVFSENLVKAIEQGMAAAFERSTALCVNEMHRVFDYYNRRWEARRLAGGGVGYDQSGHAAGQAYSSSPHSSFIWDDASGNMTDKLESIGYVEMGVGYGYEVDDFVGVGGVVSDVKESDCVLVSGQLSSESRQFASIGDLGKFHAAGDNLNLVEGYKKDDSRRSSVSEVGELRNHVEELKAVVPKLNELNKVDVEKIRSLESEVVDYKFRLEKVSGEKEGVEIYLEEEKEADVIAAEMVKSPDVVDGGCEVIASEGGVSSLATEEEGVERVECEAVVADGGTAPIAVKSSVNKEGDATKALYNALEFARTNFNNEMEMNYLMQVICDAALAKEVEIRKAAFECLVSIASTYYEVLEPYMQRIFELTSNAVKRDEEAIALQALKFWSSICDVELELQDYEVLEIGNSDAPHSFFIQKALTTLVPMLLETLLQQDEEQNLDDGTWNLAMAGGTCLGLVAKTVGNAVVPLVMPFVEANISKIDWRCREAATYAFGSILEGPSVEKLSPMVNVGLDFLLNAVNDDNSHVKDTIAMASLEDFYNTPSLGDKTLKRGDNCHDPVGGRKRIG